MARLLVTGVSGLLGVNLTLKAIEKGFDVVGWSNTRRLKNTPFEQATVSLERLESLATALDDAQPDAIVHCAAIANLDAAEINPKLTNLVNAQAPGVLAEAAAKRGVPFVQISTEAIFDGKKGNYVEDDTPNPQNTYAQSKLAGEIAVRQAYSEALIARVVFHGWSLSGTRSLAEFFYNNLSQGKRCNGFTDSIFSPLYVGDLANLLLEALSVQLTGTYHFFSSESLSKYDFGVALARRFGLDEDLISPVITANGDLQTQRSLNLSSNPARLEAALGRQMPGIDEGIQRLYEDFQKGHRKQLLDYLA